LNNGFLGTAAPLAADLVLLLEIAMGVGLLIGARLARIGRFRQHSWCQSTIVLLNVAVVAMMMIPSFHVHVFPRVPAKLGKAYYALATTHGAFGAVTELRDSTSCYLRARTFWRKNYESPNIRCGCEASSCSGGSSCYWEWRHTRVGTCSICFGNRFALCV
jgi:hypothetical protein